MIDASMTRKFFSPITRIRSTTAPYHREPHGGKYSSHGCRGSARCKTICLRVAGSRTKAFTSSVDRPIRVPTNKSCLKSPTHHFGSNPIPDVAADPRTARFCRSAGILRFMAGVIRLSAKHVKAQPSVLRHPSDITRIRRED